MSRIFSNALSVFRSPAFWSMLFAPFFVHWAIVEPVAYYFPEFAEKFIKEAWPYTIPASLIIGLVLAWPRSTFKCKISGTDIIVQIKVGSIFDSKNPLVFGVSTHFDTSTEDGSISRKSIQGQFTHRYFRHPRDFEAQIEREKKRLTPAGTSTPAEKPFGPRVRYDRGEIICIQAEKRAAFLVTMATLNSHKTATLDLNDYFDLIPKMWLGIREKGDYEDLDVPMLGAKYARMSLKFEHILTNLIRSFVAVSREAAFTKKVTFYISNADYLHGEFTAEKLARILDRECHNERIEPQRPAPSVGGQVQ